MHFSSLAIASAGLPLKHGLPYKYIDPTSSLSETSVEAFEMPAESRANFLKKGIKNLFPIQASVWAEILDGSDVLARARTGTGKTLAFALPIISKIAAEKQDRKTGRSKPKALIIAPTRELATQISLAVKEFSPHSVYSCVCYGGININPQLEILSRGVDIVIGTPGRLLDLYERGALQLGDLDFIVLDEADFMLDLGFKASLESILSNVQSGVSSSGNQFPQMLLFSATVPEWVTSTAKSYFKRPHKIYVDAVGETTIRTSENIRQVALAYRGEDLVPFVTEVLTTFCPSSSVVPMKALIFCDTKRQVSHLASGLFSGYTGNIRPICGALHGDLSQNQRNDTLDDFKTGRVNVLVATDVAARGLDIADVDVVIQLNPPPMVETFIHRSGRTARAGKGGVNVLIYNPEENLSDLAEIEKIAGFKFSRQALAVGRSLVIKDKDTFSQIIKGVSVEEKNSMSAVVAGFLESNPASQKDAILSLAALLHRSFPASFKINRSALTGEKGYITLQYSPKRALNNVEELVSSLEAAISVPKILSQISLRKLSADRKSLLFDVPLEIGKNILIQNELPEVGENGEIFAVHQIPELSNDRISNSRATVSYGSMRNTSRGAGFSSPNYNRGGANYRNDFGRDRFSNSRFTDSRQGIRRGESIGYQNQSNGQREATDYQYRGTDQRKKSTTWDIDDDLI
ncbi:DEAD/DEAH box helicase [Mitosporidium daphniae]|uniref:RNA helicase n=1 Tax=Mitosporidium daphniae TaxID=1485682 RepID=A0A098VMR9_9MICR|nr:DEAD/DEAH box helicase [Mitosporidium daphniae]KGG50333.1 DEAD/DEAH box helicase [Mitosporidium daphniae]|eukprot:XP_013236774.1 DEAD/DEAH box helicase [Mitosporidium daphniae]